MAGGDHDADVGFGPPEGEGKRGSAHRGGRQGHLVAGPGQNRRRVPGEILGQEPVVVTDDRLGAGFDRLGQRRRDAAHVGESEVPRDDRAPSVGAEQNWGSHESSVL